MYNTYLFYKKFNLFSELQENNRFIWFLDSFFLHFVENLEKSNNSSKKYQLDQFFYR